MSTEINRKMERIDAYLTAQMQEEVSEDIISSLEDAANIVWRLNDYAGWLRLHIINDVKCWPANSL